MKKAGWILAAGLLFGGSKELYAENGAVIQLMSGETYLDAEVVGRDAAYLTIQHSTGVVRVPLTLLPPETLKQIGYDPLAALKQRGAEKRAQEQFEAAQEKAQKQKIRDARKIYIWGVVKSFRDDGYAVMDAVRYGEIEEEYTRFIPGDKNSEGGKSLIHRRRKGEIRMDGVLIAGLPETTEIGKRWAGNVWPSGEMKIRNKDGAITGSTTRYATSVELAERLAKSMR